MPRLRQRVVDDPLRLRTPAWVATDVDPAYHLTRVRLAADEGTAGALEVAAGLHMAPFDIALEPGQFVLGGSFTSVVKARAGDTFHVDYGPFGTISARFV